MQAFQGLRGCDAFTQAVRSGQPICFQHFTADLRQRVRAVWQDTASVDPLTGNNKLATYRAWFATPFADDLRAGVHAYARNGGAPLVLPRHLFLDIPKQVMRNVNRFRLRAHTLKVESVAWTGGSDVCDKCSCQQTQHEVHALFFCQDPTICALRVKYSYLFSPYFSDFSVARPYLLDVVPNQRIFHFLSQRHNKFLFFISDLMDYFLAGVDQQQTYQPNGLADGQP